MRSGKLWFLLAAMAAVAVFATAALSFQLVQLDAAQKESRRSAWIEENVRLALWRIDSRLAAFLSQAVAIMGEPGNRPSAKNRTLSLDAIPDGQWIRGILQVDPNGHTHIVGQLDRSDELAQTLRDLIPPGQVPALRRSLEPFLPETQLAGSDPNRATGPGDDRDLQSLKNRSEYLARRQIVQQQANTLPGDPFEDAAQVGMFAGSSALGGAITPIWWNQKLLLARSWNQNGVIVRLILLDWPSMQRDLRALVADVLHNAKLEPVADPDDADKARMLASLPVRIDPGPILYNSPDSGIPIKFILLITWSALALAILATATLIRGLVALSDRRAAFVSSVTHELRTPLTTLRMYAEMLADNIVNDPQQRREYLATLRGEADRLATLVENVLAYARLERRAAKPPSCTIPLADIPRILDSRILQHAKDAGFRCNLTPTEIDSLVYIQADPTSVEQILFNLVDNACKYADQAEQRTIEIALEWNNRNVSILVADYGQGISRQGRKHLFEPFQRDSKPDSPATPGVGLGLALSRQLAREMSGELRLRQSSRNGTCFELILKRIAKP